MVTDGSRYSLFLVVSELAAQLLEFLALLFHLGLLLFAHGVLVFVDLHRRHACV